MTTEQLIQAYKKAQEQLVDTIRVNDRLGTAAEYEKALLEEIKTIIAELERKSISWTTENVPTYYENAAKQTQTELLGKRALNVSFVGVNQRAVAAIVDNTVNDFTQALYQIGRRVDDQVRAVSMEVAQTGLILNQGVRKIAKTLEIKLAEQGAAMGVPDSRGRLMPADAYAQMVARTTTREATNTATINTGHMLNAHLFQMSVHYPTCKVCAPRQGRVYRDADFPPGDERNRFPHISQAFPAWPKYKTVHPNCRHVIAAVGWDAMSRESQEKMLARADEPFDLDPRSEREIAAYNAQLFKMRTAREDRKQWNRYQARLGEDAPKSFSAFRRIKNVNGLSWDVLQTKYKAMGYYNNIVKQEPAITDGVQHTAARSGMDVAGLEHRIKSQESYLRKVEYNYSPNGTTYEVKDILRYTLTADPEDLAQKTLGAISLFDETGYNTIEIKNSWAQDYNPYKGVNTTILTPQNVKIEVQYHTPESFALKNGGFHALYEKQRVLTDPTSLEFIQLRDQMFALSSTLTWPANIERVKSK